MSNQNQMIQVGMNAAYGDITNVHQRNNMRTQSNEAYGTRQHLSDDHQIQIGMNAAYGDLKSVHQVGNIPLEAQSNEAYGTGRQKPEAAYQDGQPSQLLPPRYEDLRLQEAQVVQAVSNTNYAPQLMTGQLEPTGQPKLMGPTPYYGGQPLPYMSQPYVQQPGIPQYINESMAPYPSNYLQVAQAAQPQQMVYYPPNYQNPSNVITNQVHEDQQQSGFCFSTAVCCPFSITMLIFLVIIGGPLTLLCTIPASVFLIMATRPNSVDPRKQRDTGGILMVIGATSIVILCPCWTFGIAYLIIYLTILS